MSSGIVHVMVAVLRDARGRVLINQRPPGKMQAGRWEFPGGKLEPGERRFEALQRELHEELGIDVLAATPLIRVRHRYPDIEVLLDVMEVTQWSGIPGSREHQPLKWVLPDDLPAEDILEADMPIIRAIRLPDRLLITPEPESGRDFLACLVRSLEAGIGLVQFRAHSLGDGEYRALAEDVLRCCRDHGARLILNRDIETVADLPADGIHLTSHYLGRRIERPGGMWLSIACHGVDELKQAQMMDVDFALLSPVLAKASHPETPALGWDAFRESVEAVALPVYALGGMASSDIGMARENGGQGIAAIRSLWRCD